MAMVETTDNRMISVTVNGDVRPIAAGCTIKAMLGAIAIDPKRVAVERNVEIVPRSTFDTVVVSDGDSFEIVHFVGGG